jgi:hypothetical protein
MGNCAGCAGPIPEEREIKRQQHNPEALYFSPVKKVRDMQINIVSLTASSAAQTSIDRVAYTVDRTAHREAVKS